MKRLLVLMFCALGVTQMLAQVPKLINYQGAVRNDAGQPLKNRVISVKFELRTGSSGGPSIWQATESVTTNLLGLFNTQIGKVNASEFQQVDWGQGPMFLSVSIDTTNGSSHTEMGVQELVGVPYAFRALTVPVSYSANILTIGQQSFDLGASQYSAGTGISIVSGSVVNTAPDVSVAINAGSNMDVSGIYPDYTVSAVSQSLTLNGSDLSITGGNTVTLPSASEVSVVSSGAAITTTLSASLYSIHVAEPTFTNSGAVTISGSYPNYTVNSGTSNANLVTSGAATLTNLGPNSFSVHVPIPQITQSTNIVVSGVYPSFSISANPSLGVNGNSIGISGGNSVTIPAPVLTQSTNVSVLSNGANFTISSNPSLGVNGNSIGISGGNSVTIPAPVLTQSTNVSVLSNGPNFTISSNPVLGVNGNSIGISGGNSVTVPAPVLTQSTNVSVLSNGANFTISSNPVLGVNGNSIGISGGNSVTVPAPVLTQSTNVSVLSSGSNFTISSNPSLGVNGNSIGISGGNSVTIPPPVITQSTNIRVNSVGSSFTISSNPTISIASGSIGITGGNTIALPAVPTVTASGLAFVSGGPNYTVSVPTLTYMSANGYLVSGNNSVVITPSLSLNGSTLSVGQATNSIDLSILSPWKRSSPSVTLSNATDYVGLGVTAPTVRLDVAGSAAVKDNTLVTGYVGSFENNNSSNGQSSGALSAVSSGPRSVGNAAVSIQNLTTKSGGSNSTKTGLEIISTGSWGPATPNQPNRGLFVNVGGADNNYPAILMGGNVGINTTAPDALLNVDGSIDIGISNTVVASATSIAMGYSNSISGIVAGAIGSHNTISGNRSYALGNFTDIGNLGSMALGDWGGGGPSILTSSADDQFSARFRNGYRFFTDNALTTASAVVIGADGNVGIGQVNPAFKLDLGNNANPTKGIGLHTDNSTFFYGFGNDSRGSVGYIDFYAGANTSAGSGMKMSLGSTGRLGIGNSTPQYKVSVLGSSGSAFDGPNISFATTDDAYPTFHLLNWNHSEQWMMFNAYYDGVFRSSSNESNFAIVSQNYSSDALQFKYASGVAQGSGISWTDGMVMRNNGWVGIGVSSPLYQFHVEKDDPGTLAWFDNNSLAGGTCLLAQVTTSASSAGTRYGIQSNAWYGQGSQYGTYSTAWYGTNSNYGVYAYGFGGTNSYGLYGIAGGSSSTNYGVYCSGSGGYTGSWSNVSDRKFKENIRPMTGALDKIMRLSPKVYTLKRDQYSYMNFPAGDQLGLIAQEVEEVLPELVEQGSNPGPLDPATKKPTGETEYYKSMNYIGLTPVLVKAIQEQQAQIEQLKVQLEEQKRLIEELKNK